MSKDEIRLVIKEILSDYASYEHETAILPKARRVSDQDYRVYSDFSSMISGFSGSRFGFFGPFSGFFSHIFGQIHGPPATCSIQVVR